MKVRATVTVFFALAVSGCASGHLPTVEFEHLRTVGSSIESTNALRVRVDGENMRVIGPEHRRDVFDGHPYEISLAAFVGGQTAVMVHSERVADASGASNYGNLPVAEWPSPAFRSRQSCVTLTPDDVQGEHDLEWLRAGGYDPAGSLLLDQSFLTTADHNDEVVVSVIVKGVACDDRLGVEAALAAARARVRVTVQGE